MPKQAPALPKIHYLDLVDGKFASTSRADLKAAFASLARSPERDHLLVHFHGGLVSRAGAMANARKLLPVLTSGGAYPIFFVWNSDLLTQLIRNLHDIANEEVFRHLAKRVTRLVLGKLGETGGARGGRLALKSPKEIPDNLKKLSKFAEQEERKYAGKKVKPVSPQQKKQFEQELKLDPVLKKDTQRIAAGLRTEKEIQRDLKAAARGGPPARGSRKTLMSPRVLAEISKESKDTDTRSMTLLVTLAKYAVTIVIAVVKRFATGRDHGLYTTVVEEICRELYIDTIGGSIWSAMKKDTEDAFQDGRGGAAFIEEVATWWKPGRRITLVGHSTGALYIGRFLRHLHGHLPAAAKCGVVFLAPACSFAFVHENLDVLQKRASHIRLFGLCDATERGYWEVPGIYKGSLLYLVSGLFELDEVDLPILGMERYFSGAKPYHQKELLAVRKYLNGNCVWSVAQGTLGRGCTAPKHGGFHEDNETLSSLKHILQNGF